MFDDDGNDTSRLGMAVWQVEAPESSFAAHPKFSYPGLSYDVAVIR